MIAFASVPTLIATLGFAPQVITRSLDCILQADIEPQLKQVVIVHTSTFQPREPHWPSFPHFISYLEARYPQLTFIFTPITDKNGRILYDIDHPDAAEKTFATLFRVIRELKQANCRLHGLISGGRKIMIVYLMVACQLLFGEEDRLWYLFSSQLSWEPHNFAETGLSLDRLVEIPFFHLAATMPMMHALIVDSNDPIAAMRLYRQKQTPGHLHKLQQFYQSCDAIDQQILLLSHQGYSQQQIGEQVGLSVSAVTNRLSKAADQFYTHVYGKPLRPRPKHIGRKFVEDMGPFLRGIV